MDELASLHQLVPGVEGACFQSCETAKSKDLDIHTRFHLERTIMGEKVEKRSWSDLPTELLQKIADDLVLIELINFRSVCKEWRSASSHAIAKTNSEEDGLHPWFLVYGDGSHCSLHVPSSGNVYTSCIPELESSTCIASKDGWLLIHRKELLFFFCPFSRARIDLPMLPSEAEFRNHLAAFSCAPTSPSCIVCIFNNKGDVVEVNMLTRGADQWTKHEQTFNGRPGRSRYTCVSFREELLYIVYSRGVVYTFSIKDHTCHRYTMVPDGHPGGKDLPIVSVDNNYTLDKETRKKMGLEEGDSISTCGTVLQFGRDFSKCIDSQSSEAQEVNNEAEKGKENRHKKGVWIHPRFFQLPTNQSWSL